MTNQELQIFLNIIDSRIKKYVNENKLLKEYPAIVTGIVTETETDIKPNDECKVKTDIKPNDECKVKLAGYDTEFIFINKTHETLNIGNFVYVKTIGTDLNTGVISQKNS